MRCLCAAFSFKKQVFCVQKTYTRIFNPSSEISLQLVKVLALAFWWQKAEPITPKSCMMQQGWHLAIYMEAKWQVNANKLGQKAACQILGLAQELVPRDFVNPAVTTWNLTEYIPQLAPLGDAVLHRSILTAHEIHGPARILAMRSKELRVTVIPPFPTTLPVVNSGCGYTSS